MSKDRDTGRNLHGTSLTKDPSVSSASLAQFGPQTTNFEREQMSPRIKQQIRDVNTENRRLYGRIVDIDNSLQFGFLGLNKTKANPQDRALEAGLVLNAKLRHGEGSRSPARKHLKLKKLNGILEKDRVRDHGGHSAKYIQLKNVQIDNENIKIL